MQRYGCNDDHVIVCRTCSCAHSKRGELHGRSHDGRGGGGVFQPLLVLTPTPTLPCSSRYYPCEPLDPAPVFEVCSVIPQVYPFNRMSWFGHRLRAFCMKLYFSTAFAKTTSRISCWASVADLFRLSMPHEKRPIGLSPNMRHCLDNPNVLPATMSVRKGLLTFSECGLTRTFRRLRPRGPALPVACCGRLEAAQVPTVRS